MSDLKQLERRVEVLEDALRSMVQVVVGADLQHCADGSEHQVLDELGTDPDGFRDFVRRSRERAGGGK